MRWSFPIVLVALLGCVASLPMHRQESAWSPDGAEIVYWSDDGESREICSVAPDGTGLRNLTRDPREQANAVFSPDGRRLAYFERREGRGQIVVAPRSGGDVVSISDGRWDDFNPSWSPDGQTIAFQSVRDGDSDLFVVDLATRETRALTENETHDTNPAFSPEGERLAWVSHRHETPQVYVLDLTTREERRLTLGNVAYRNPKWSPDGSWIAYHSDEMVDGVERGRIFLQRVADLERAGGEGPRVLVAHPSYNFNPFFSPDGRWIVFSSDRTGEIGLYRIRPDGSEETTIVPGFCHERESQPPGT